MTQPEPRRWFRKPANFVKVTAELIVEIDNASALEQAALKAADEIDTDEEDKAAMSVEQ